TVGRHWIELSDLNWGLVFLLYTILALLEAGTIYTTDLAERHPVRYYYPLIWEFTGYYLAFAMLPFYVFVFGRLPVRRVNGYWPVPLHLLISIASGAVHTLLMRVTREMIYALLGLGTYDYGSMGYRFLMEYHKQFVAYWFVYAMLRGLAFYRQ